MSIELDPMPQNALGLIVLSTDETLENEARTLLAEKPVRLHHSRIFSADDVTTASLSDMRARIERSAGLLPESVGAVGYACTSASGGIGPEAVADRVRAGRPGVFVTDPISAVIAALERLGLFWNVCRPSDLGARRADSDVRFQTLIDEARADRKAANDKFESLQGEIRQNQRLMLSGQERLDAILAEVLSLSRRVQAVEDAA